MSVGCGYKKNMLVSVRLNIRYRPIVISWPSVCAEISPDRQTVTHTILVRRFLADLDLPVVEVAFIHPDLSAEGMGGNVVLKEGLILRSKCVYLFHLVFL